MALYKVNQSVFLYFHRSSLVAVIIHEICQRVAHIHQRCCHMVQKKASISVLTISASFFLAPVYLLRNLFNFIRGMTTHAKLISR